MTTEEKERKGTLREVREFVPPAEYPIKLVAKMLGIEYKSFMNYTTRNKIASFKKGGRRYVSVEEFKRIKSAMADGSFPGKRGRRRKMEDGGRRTEDGGRRMEDGGQRTEDRGQRTEDRGRRTEDRGRRTEDRGRRMEKSQPTKIVDRRPQKKLIDKAIDFGEEIQKHKQSTGKVDDNQPKTEDGGQRTEDGGRKIEDGECLLDEKPLVINIKIGTVNFWAPKESESEKIGNT